MRNPLLRVAYLLICLSAPGLVLAQNLNRDRDPQAVAEDYLMLHADELGLAAEDVVDLVLVDRHTSSHNGLTHLYFQQELDGIRVFNGIVNVSVDSDGAIATVGNRAIGNLARKVNTTRPDLSPEAALGLAAEHLNLQPKAPIKVVKASLGANYDTTLSSAGIASADIPAQLVYVYDLAGDTVRLAWNLGIQQTDGAHWWQVQVDAVDGGVLDKADWIANDSYRVYALPVGHPGVGSRTLEVNPADSIHSPFNWHDTDGVAGAEFTDTRGNNVDARTNASYRPSGGASLIFDFPHDLTMPPNTQADPTVTQLFYINNMMHDIHARYGFDEASGNFQETNYTGSGTGSDSVNAIANMFNTNNATMSTPPEGSNPTMNMYIWSGSGGLRHTVFDTLIPVHEYGHGVSNRLTGGASNVSCLNQAQARSMGEGWSDWWGLVMTALPTDISTDARASGVWVTNSSAGIRPYPYSADTTINPMTYGDITSGLSVPHGVGTVWATTLWDIYWSLVEAYGFDSNLHNGTGGNNIAMQLVMDGLKLQPCNPSFLDARDAILQADINNYGGVNQCLLWQAFAKRGMGAAAYDGGSASTLAVTEDFTVPVSCRTDAFIEDTPYGWGGLPDMGYETDPNMASAPMWKSRHIWVRKNNDGIYSHQNPEFGQTNYVYARLQNRGPLASPLRPASGHVEFYYAYASSGLTWPTDWTKFGQTPVANLPVWGVEDVVAPFNPPGTGHYCLTAIWVSTQDPLGTPLGSSINTNTRNNNNEAWRNVNIVDLDPNFVSVVWFLFRNIYEVEGHVGLRIKIPQTTADAPIHKIADVVIRLPEDILERWMANGARGRDVKLTSDRGLQLVGDNPELFDIPMGPREAAKVGISFDLRGADLKGEHTLDAVQVQDQREVGGVGYVIRQKGNVTNPDQETP